MPWKNASKDGVPERYQEVLISIDGVNYIATYNDAEKGFEVKDTKRFFWIKNNTIYWQLPENPKF